MSINIELKNYDEVVKGLKDCQKDLAKGVRRVQLDMAKREVKTAARNAVTEVYNVKKGDVTAKCKGYEQTGAIDLAGVSIPLFVVKFEQTRTFTPTHFGMTPKARPAGNRKYAVRWKPLRAGAKAELKSDSGMPVFIQSPAGVALPFARLGKARYPMDVIRTHLSIPQMVDNEKVQPNLEKEIQERIQGKLDKFLKN